MKIITVEDCHELKAKFDKYCETAEQHEFPKLATIDIMLEITLKKIDKAGTVENQKEARSMFRVVLKTIGKDYSDYIEEENKNE